MKEEFRDIKGYECYQVSNLGRVKSLKRKKPCILKNIMNVHGYYFVNLHKDNKNKAPRIHQLVAIAFLNHNPDGFKLVVDHIDNDKTNNNASNLQLISNRENTSKDKKGYSSKYVGVYWDSTRKKWRSSILLNKKRIYLGRYVNEIDAANAYKNALKNL